MIDKIWFFIDFYKHSKKGIEIYIHCMGDDSTLFLDSAQSNSSYNLKINLNFSLTIRHHSCKIDFSFFK